MFVIEKISGYMRRMFDIPTDFEIVILRQPRRLYPKHLLGRIVRLLKKHNIRSWANVCNQKLTVCVWTEKEATEAIEILSRYLNVFDWTHYFWSLDSLCYAIKKDKYVLVNSASDRFSEPVRCKIFIKRTIPMFEWNYQEIRLRDLKRIDINLIPKFS